MHECPWRLSQFIRLNIITIIIIIVSIIINIVIVFIINITIIIMTSCERDFKGLLHDDFSMNKPAPHRKECPSRLRRYQARGTALGT